MCIVLSVGNQRFSSKDNYLFMNHACKQICVIQEFLKCDEKQGRSSKKSEAYQFSMSWSMSWPAFEKRNVRIGWEKKSLSMAITSEFYTFNLVEIHVKLLQGTIGRNLIDFLKNTKKVS